MEISGFPQHYIDALGKKFEKLTPVGLYRTRPDSRANGGVVIRFRCHCDCGRTDVERDARAVLRGRSKSCGCHKKNSLKKSSRTTKAQKAKANKTISKAIREKFDNSTPWWGECPFASGKVRGDGNIPFRNDPQFDPFTHWGGSW